MAALMTKTEWLASTIARLQQNDPTLTNIQRIGDVHLAIAELLTEEDGVALADALVGNTHVTSITIKGSNILDIGGAAIANALKDNRTVTSIVLRNNGFVPHDATSHWVTGTAIAAISELLQVNNTVTELNLRGNDLADAGIVVLCEGLKVNTSIKTLNLEYTDMGNAGVAALAAMLRVNQSIKTLAIGCNDYSVACLAILEESLKNNFTLLECFVDYWYNAQAINTILIRNMTPSWSVHKHKTFDTQCHMTIMATLMSANKATSEKTLPRMLPELWEGHIFPHFKPRIMDL
jgi:hypothetical protein